MINIFAPINLLGYGIHANNILKALMDMNIPVNLTKLGQPQVDPYFEPYYKAADRKVMEFDAKSPSIFIFHDELSNQSSGSPLAVFSVFETSILKPLSKHMLINGPADIIFVTTQQHADILKANGITKPIQVVREGVDDTIYNTLPPNKYIDTKKFTFIAAGKNEKRKQTTELIKAFIEAAKGEEVALIAHTFNPFLNKQKDHPFKNLQCWIDFDPGSYGYKYLGWNGKAHRFSNGKTDIYFTAPSIQTAEMACLYHSANVGIQVSHGEGWDLPLSEMLACGLPTIATDCLGHREYLTGLKDIMGDLIIPPTGSETAKDGIWFKGDQGVWDTFNTTAIRDKIKLVLENRDKYTNKSEDISTYMTTNFSWTKTADTIKAILKV